MSETPTRKLRVIGANEVHSGTNDRGGTWHLYEIVATTLEGEPIDLKLKSFEKLDGDVEVEVEKQTHEKYGVSYMLKTRGAGGSRSGSGLGPKVDELRGRLERLEGMFDALQSTVRGLQTLVTQLSREQSPGQPALPAYGQPRNAVFGDEDEPSDIPF